jgi:uncharacterized protein YkwD
VPGSGDEACLSTQEEAFLVLINEHRADNDLPPLTNSRKLNIAAHTHSLDMGTRNYYAHDTMQPLPPGQSGPAYTDRINDAGYTGWTAAEENIAGGHSTADAVFTAWKNSPEHNLKMLDPDLTQIGIGFVYVPGSQFRYYWTTDLANGSDSGPGC